MSLSKRFDRNIQNVTSKASELIKSRYGLWFLGLLSFVESTLLIPLITDPFMVAYILVHRSRTFTAVVVTIATSVLGALVAYITAAFFMDLIMVYLSAGTIQTFNSIVESFRNETFALAFLGAVTPIPFTLAALAAGMIKGNLLLFLAGALIGRTVRYGVVGYLTYRFGDQAVKLVKKNIVVLSILSVVLVGIYFVMKM